LKQVDSAWIAPGRPAAVLAAPGYAAPYPSEQIVRTFIAAAAKAGADAVELAPDHCTHSLVTCARQHGLHAVARVAAADDVSSAAQAGIKTFHVDSIHLDDVRLRRRVAEAASCVIVSDPAGHAGFAQMKNSGVQVLPLHPHGALAGRLQSPSAGARLGGDNELFGCELGTAALPASAGGVLIAASGAALVRQYLALDRYFGGKDTPHSLSQRDFREMVLSIRAAEKMLRPRPVAAARGGEPSLVAERNIHRGQILEPGHFEPAAGVEGKVAKTAVGKGYTIVASELVATVMVAIDFTTAPQVEARPLELLLSRLARAQTVDKTCAIVTGSESEEVHTMLTDRGVGLCRLRESWLAGVLELADKNEADLVVWLPAENVLADPDLLDRMVVQHVRSAADYTLCSDLPRGISPRLISAAALRRIAAFAGADADASTVHKLLSNHRVFRVQETTIESAQRKPNLDLTWHKRKQHLFERIVQTGAENAAELIERVSDLYGEDCRMSESEAREPLCAYSFVTHGNQHTNTI